jgi:hypothetical protein
MISPINEETITEDAAVVDEAEAVEVEAVDSNSDQIEEAVSDEIEAQSEEVDEPSESSPEKPDGTQKRIDELTKFRREAERDRDYWQNIAQTNQVAPESVEPGKSLADFEYDEGKFTEYLKTEARQEATSQAQQVTQQEKGASLQADFAGREKDFASNIDDYHLATSNKDLQFSEDMAVATLHAEKGPELRYYLAKNPEVSAKLSRMGQYDMSMELGRIEATKLGKNKPPSVTTAPKPVPKIAGTDSKSTMRIDDPKLSDANFRKMRLKQIANR